MLIERYWDYYHKKREYRHRDAFVKHHRVTDTTTCYDNQMSTERPSARVRDRDQEI